MKSKRSAKNSRLSASLFVGGFSLAIVGFGGCYERVVEARGFGASQMNIQKSNTGSDNTQGLILNQPDNRGTRWKSQHKSGW